MSRRTMARQLMRLIEGGEQLEPRKWAMERISCFISSEALNGQLRAHARRSGRPWTTGVAPLCWRYVPTYVNDADRLRLAPAVEELERRHGVRLIVHDVHAPPS